MDSVSQLLLSAFSGSDLARALWIALVASLFCSKTMPPLQMTAIVFGIDRIWPFFDMGLAGYGAGEIAAAVAHNIGSLPFDAAMLLVRLVGLFMLVSVGYQVRLAIHGKVAPGTNKSVLPY